jgi:hypothetical protein
LTDRGCAGRKNVSVVCACKAVTVTRSSAAAFDLITVAFMDSTAVIEQRRTNCRLLLGAPDVDGTLPMAKERRVSVRKR